MSWNKQMEDMVGTWTDMQHKLWDSWLQAVKGFGGEGVQGGEAWQQEYQRNLEAWEKSVREALDAQTQWARSWAEQVGGEQDAPEAVTQWVSQVQEMMKGWTEAQGQLWNAWFDSVKHMDPAQISASWDAEGNQVLQAWQEATQRAQETLGEWSRAAAEGAAAAPATSGAEAPAPAKSKAPAKSAPKSAPKGASKSTAKSAPKSAAKSTKPAAKSGKKA